MLRFHEGRSQTDPRIEADHTWRPIIPRLRDWGSQMRVEDIERFEAAAGDLLDELGYPRSGLNSRPEILQRVSRIHRLFAQDVRARKQRLPEQW